MSGEDNAVQINTYSLSYTCFSCFFFVRLPCLKTTSTARTVYIAYFNLCLHPHSSNPLPHAPCSEAWQLYMMLVWRATPALPCCWWPWGRTSQAAPRTAGPASWVPVPTAITRWPAYWYLLAAALRHRLKWGNVEAISGGFGSLYIYFFIFFVSEITLFSFHCLNFLFYFIWALQWLHLFNELSCGSFLSRNKGGGQIANSMKPPKFRLNFHDAFAMVLLSVEMM